MKPLSVIAIDDEPLALERLGDLLGRIEDVTVLALHDNADAAIPDVASLQPDLVLVDVEMPKVDGFDFVEALAKQPWLNPSATPLIAFVTAYPQFAAEAFDNGALDFLCKPVRVSRLEKTVARARHALAQRDALERLQELSRQLDSLRETRAPEAEPSLWVHQRGQMVRLSIDRLDWVAAEGEYVRLNLDGQSFLLRSSISALAERLEPYGFLRIHRSALVNRTRVTAIRSSRAGTTAVLADGRELPVGRKYRQSLRQLRAVE